MDNEPFFFLEINFSYDVILVHQAEQTFQLFRGMKISYIAQQAAD